MFLLIFTLICVLPILLIYVSQNGVNKVTCDMMVPKRPHKWYRKAQGENSYLVCQECDMLPGGDMEENDGNFS